MELHKEDRNLKCLLTDEEVLTYSREMAKTQQDKGETEAEKKKVMSGYTDRINQADLALSVLARKVADGFEHRTVPCEWTFDWDNDKKLLYRTDTGELVEARGITEGERQKFFKFDGDEEEPTEEEGDEGIEPEHEEDGDDEHPESAGEEA